MGGKDGGKGWSPLAGKVKGGRVENGGKERGRESRDQLRVQRCGAKGEFGSLVALPAVRASRPAVQVRVDDAVYFTKTPPHLPCAGLYGGCPVCIRFARAALRSQHGWHRLAAELSLGLSDDRRQLPSQRVAYYNCSMVVDARCPSQPRRS